MGLTQLIYSSQPFGFDEGMLAGILLDARRCNKRDGVTGALVCRRDVYLQLLEGPEAVVQATFARIQGDDRHLDVRVHVTEPVSERLFGDWDMLHDPARSWLWSEEEVLKGALTTATADDMRKVFTRLAGAMQTRPPD